MKKPLKRQPMSHITLHPELDRLGREIEKWCERLELRVDALCPIIHPIVFTYCYVTYFGEEPKWLVVGNWPAYRRARTKGLAKVPIHDNTILENSDQHIVSIRALTSVARRSKPDLLLLGLIYRCWTEYEQREIRLRPTQAQNHQHILEYGTTYRKYLHRALSRRLDRSIRDLERCASVLDVPTVWLKQYRAGQVNLQALERIHALTPTDQDDLTDGVREGVPLNELIRDFDLMPDRKQRRLKSSIAALNRNLQDTMNLLRSQKAAQSEAPDADLLRTVSETIGRANRDCSLDLGCG